MEARGAGGTDVHPGAFPDRLEALQDRNVLGVVRHARTFRSEGGAGRLFQAKTLVRAPKSNVVILSEGGRESAPKRDVPIPSEHFLRRFHAGRDRGRQRVALGWSADRQRDGRAQSGAVGNDHVAGPGGKNSGLPKTRFTQLHNGAVERKLVENRDRDQLTHFRAMQTHERAAEIHDALADFFPNEDD